MTSTGTNTVAGQLDTFTSGTHHEAAPADADRVPVGLATCWALGTAGPGSPGATSLALALAVHSGALLVEADADGGVLGARCGCYLHEAAPSLASLLAALPSGMDAARLDEHTQRLPGGIRAALLAPAGEDAAGPVGHLPHALPALRRALPGGHVVLDVGRLRPASSAMHLIDQVDVTVITTAPTVDGLSCLLARLPVLAAATPALVVAVRGTGPYTPADIRAEIGSRTGTSIDVIWVPEDPRGLTKLLTTVPHPPRRRWLPTNGSGSLIGTAAHLYATLTTLTQSRALRTGTSGGAA